MDILVRTPKKETEIARRESCDEIVNNPDAFWFRVYNFRPKTEIGDKIYFIEGTEVTGYSTIFAIEDLENGFMVCDTTDRIWYGKCVIKFRGWTWLTPRPKYEGFVRGIRYVPHLPDEIRKQLER